MNTGIPEQGLETGHWRTPPPPKPLEIQSADINLGGLSPPPGSPLLHCYDAHWPGAPFSWCRQLVMMNTTVTNRGL